MKKVIVLVSIPSQSGSRPGQEHFAEVADDIIASQYPRSRAAGRDTPCILFVGWSIRLNTLAVGQPAGTQRCELCGTEVPKGLNTLAVGQPAGTQG